MNQANASVALRNVNSGVIIFDIHGEVNANAESVLLDCYTQACERGAEFILLNFQGMDYMNSYGIGLLITLLIRCKRQQQNLMAYNLDEHYRSILDLTRLDEAIGIFSNETEALEHLHCALGRMSPSGG